MMALRFRRLISKFEVLVTLWEPVNPGFLSYRSNLVRDQQILAAARKDAAWLLERDPDLVQPEHRGLRAMAEASASKGSALATIG